MDRNDVNWRGYWPAAPTPYTRDGALDEGAWRQLLRLYASWGMHGVLVNGTTGEWFSQTDAERKRIAEIATEEVGGKLTVVIGCTTYTPGQTIELARHARGIGADGVLSTPPPYAHPTQDEIVSFYRAVSDGVDMPLMAYNWPRGVAVEIQADTALRLAEIPGVVAIKNSTSNPTLFAEILTTCVPRLRVFGNYFSPRGIELMQSVGGDGFIGGGALLGAENPEFFEAVWRGDTARALAIARKQMILDIRLTNPDYSGKFGSPQAWTKAAMNMLGQPGGYPRPPLLPVEDPARLAGIADALRAAGLEVRQPVGAR